jgi:hypothetical protein
MKRATFCRFIPDFHGSPVWLEVKEAEELLRKAHAYLDRMIALSAHPRDKAYWQAKNPRIEYVRKSK